VLGIAAGGMLVPSLAPAAEIRLKSQCNAAGPIVKLGDLAEIAGTDQTQTETLAAVELFPAPPAAAQRFVRVRELQDLLLLRGVNLVEHQFSGSSQVSVTAEGRPAKPQPGPALSASVIRRANRRACEAVEQYLEGHAPQDELEEVREHSKTVDRVKTRPAKAGRSRIVEVELSESQARLLADPRRAITISGGRAPWTGEQRFQVTVQTPEGPLTFPLDARVKVPTAVVLACHSLGRGAVIRPEDVELCHDPASEENSAALHSLDEVVGRETTRAVPAGKSLSSDSLRSPLLVRKGEVVTVYAVTAGIRVRTTARARDEGSRGDLVAVESLTDRGTYFARVSGIREVEVYARSSRVEPVQTGRSETILR
jgi:flagella basal body P-ring formation protein FlgA